MLVGKQVLFDLIGSAKEVGFEVIEVFTNGTLLDQEYVDFFADQGVQVAITLYSQRPEVHDGITGVSGSFGKTLTNIERMRLEGVGFRVGTVVMEENASFAQETMAWLRRTFPLSEVCQDTIRCTSGGRQGNVACLTADLCKRRIRSRPSFPKTSRASFDANRMFHPCLNGQACVHSDGKVFSCIMERTRVLGDVTISPLSEIIRGKKTQELWTLSKDRIEVCKDCEFRYACFDCRPIVWSMAELLNPGGFALDTKDPYCLYDPYSGSWRKVEEFVGGLSEKGFLLDSSETKGN